MNLRQWLEQADGLMTTVFLGLGLLVTLPVAATMLAQSTGLPSGSFGTDLLLWMATITGLGWLTIFAARRLRARRFGGQPPSEPVSTLDVIVSALSALYGPLVLCWFAPRLLELRPQNLGELLSELRMRWVDCVLIIVGVAMVGWPLRALERYILRR